MRDLRCGIPGTEGQPGQRCLASAWHVVPQHAWLLPRESRCTVGPVVCVSLTTNVDWKPGPPQPPSSCRCGEFASLTPSIFCCQSHLKPKSDHVTSPLKTHQCLPGSKDNVVNPLGRLTGVRDLPHQVALAKPVFSLRTQTQVSALIVLLWNYIPMGACA